MATNESAAFAIDPDQLVDCVEMKRLDDGSVLMEVYGNTDFSFFFGSSKDLRASIREIIEQLRTGDRFHLCGGDVDDDDTHNTCTDDCVVVQRLGPYLSLTDNSINSSYSTVPDLIRLLEEELARFEEEDASSGGSSEEDSSDDSSSGSGAEGSSPDSAAGGPEQRDQESVQFDPLEAATKLAAALSEYSSDKGWLQ